MKRILTSEPGNTSKKGLPPTKGPQLSNILLGRYHPKVLANVRRKPLNAPRDQPREELVEFVLWPFEGHFYLCKIADARVRLAHEHICFFPAHIAVRQTQVSGLLRLQSEAHNHNFGMVMKLREWRQTLCRVRVSITHEGSG